MKKFILGKIRNQIKDQYKDYTNDKLDTIMYGIEGLYITITKTVVIFAIALALGILKELLLLLIFFNIIRMIAFGMHAQNGMICLILSSFIFLIGAYLIKYITLDNYLIWLLYLFCLINVVLFAPADTVKRPLIKTKKRMIYKILSIITVIIYFIISIFIKINYIKYAMIYGLIIEVIFINPITYWLFKLPYNNYKKYGLNTK